MRITNEEIRRADNEINRGKHEIDNEIDKIEHG